MKIMKLTAHDKLPPLCLFNHNDNPKPFTLYVLPADHLNHCDSEFLPYYAEFKREFNA
jgi:hypothetical protein